MGKGERKRGFVPASSVEAYQRQSPDLRAARVTYWLARMAEPYMKPNPTSAEMSQWVDVMRYTLPHDVPLKGLELTLFIRRGLSDAKARGLVEHAGKRHCTVANTLAITWRVRSR
jgi:hypothetical protein